MSISHDKNIRKGLVEYRAIIQGNLLREQKKYESIMGHNKITCWQNKVL